MWIMSTKSEMYIWAFLSEHSSIYNFILIPNLFLKFKSDKKIWILS